MMCAVVTMAIDERMKMKDVINYIQSLAEHSFELKIYVGLRSGVQALYR